MFRAYYPQPFTKVIMIQTAHLHTSFSLRGKHFHYGTSFLFSKLEHFLALKESYGVGRQSVFLDSYVLDNFSLDAEKPKPLTKTHIRTIKHMRVYKLLTIAVYSVDEQFPWL